MARKTSFEKLMSDLAREAARRERDRQKGLREAARAQERARRDAQRTATSAAKETKQRYLEQRAAEVEDKNKELEQRLQDLSEILLHTLHIDDTITFDSLRVSFEFPDFALPPELRQEPTPPNKEAMFAAVKKPGVLDRLVPGAERRYQEALNRAEAAYELARASHEADVSIRDSRIRDRQGKYDEEKRAAEVAVTNRNQEVVALENAYRSGEPGAVATYCTMVLERSEYPDGFPQEFRMAYVPEPKQLVVEYELPGVRVVPTVAEYHYNKSKDSEDERLRKPAEVKGLYQDIVASVCLRTIHELMEADQGNHVDVVVFSGFVETVDPTTGHDVRPCLISTRTTKERFGQLNLARVDKRACLRNLGAQVSPRPDEMQPVKPVIEFDMVDKRFVEQSDVLSDLESRPNLMELTPFEFENLVSNVFDRMGLQTKQTRSSRDGGVDAVGFDERPILGGKVVIQAKRYKDVVGVSAVRDLYGTMINEGANKGILVTTSHYGPDAYDFAKDKPIELVDGGGLLYLLDQSGVKARIVFPED